MLRKGPVDMKQPLGKFVMVGKNPIGCGISFPRLKALGGVMTQDTMALIPFMRLANI